MKFLKTVGWWSLYALIAVVVWFLLIIIFGILGSFYYDGENSTAGAIYTATMLIFPVVGSSLCAVAFSRLVPKKMSPAINKESGANIEPVSPDNFTDTLPQQGNPKPHEVASVPTSPSVLLCCKCGVRAGPNGSFCTNCGSPLSAAVLPSRVPQAVQHSRPEPLYYQQPVMNAPCCPRCGSSAIQYQTINEDRGAGCFTIFLYILLAITILGLFVLIPLLLRSNSQTTTYAVCQSCGLRRRV